MVKYYDRYRLLKRLLIEVALFLISKSGRRHSFVGYATDQVLLRIALDGLYEADELNTLKKFLADRDVKCDVAVDIGANIGNHSVFFSDFFSRVISFEASCAVFDVLSLNIKGLNNVEAHNIGIGNEACVMQLTLNTTNYGGARLKFDGDDPLAEDVEVRTLSEALGDVQPSLIKIDVEGMEYEVLEGAAEIIDRYKPIVVLEQSREEIVNGLSRCSAFLIERDYDVYQLKENFWFGDGRLAKALKFLLQSLMGRTIVCARADRLEDKFHHMVVFVPKTS